ncbi:MAG: FAD-binding domain-containing protein [Pseudomonadota bacterium]
MPLDADTPTTVPFVASREAGLERLEGFLPNAGRAYANTRNYDFGPERRDNVSVLSPYIRHRLVLETDVLAAVRARFAFSTAEKFIQEVFWRTYFKGWLEQRPGVWSLYESGRDERFAILEKDRDLARRYREAVNGETGIACFDAWAHELVGTGYLHNHTRMWFASIWIFTLKLPWELGADFFYRHLVDGDPASNTLSWRWVGGLHTKGKTYLARASNIEKYTEGRFEPHRLSPEAPALTEAETPGKRSLRPAADAPPAGKSVLLITEEDGCPDDLFRGSDIAAGVSLLATDDRSPLEVGDHAKAFAEAGLADAATRASEAFGCEVAAPKSPDNWADVLRTAAADAGTKQIVTAYCPVGPVAARVAQARDELKSDGIEIVEVRRLFDETAWPHATKGFFALKTKIQDILETLDRAQGVLDL